MTEKWFVFKNEEGGIIIDTLTPHPDLIEGNTFPSDSSIAQTLGEDTPLTVLVVCTDAQNALLTGIDAFDEHSQAFDSLINTLIGLIAATRGKF